MGHNRKLHSWTGWVAGTVWVFLGVHKATYGVEHLDRGAIIPGLQHD